MKRKLLTEIPVCPRERLVIISYTTGLSFAKERIGPLAAIITTVFYLLTLYLFALPNTPENPFASIYSETLIKTRLEIFQRKSRLTTVKGKKKRSSANLHGMKLASPQKTRKAKRGRRMQGT
jgi:hypothetical protein